MVVLKEIKYLLIKELVLEFRNRTAISGLMLYVAATIYVSYLTFRQITDLPTWNALFWIILLFSSFNVAGRSFDKEGGGREIYLYTLGSAPSVILSKILFNTLLLAVLSTFSWLIYMLLLGTQPLENADMMMFCAGIIAGSAGFGAILTLIAGIAYKTDNNIGLTAVLGFPVILPFLLTLIRFSKNALDGISWSVNIRYLLVLLLLNIVVWVLSYILFPYLWRD
jgi:heme exporter protein B